MCMPKKAASTGREEPGYRVDSLVAIAEATSSQSPPTKSWIYRDCITFRHEPYVSGYNLSLVKRGEPQRAAAVAGVDQRLRVGLPGGRDIVAIDVRNPAGRTVPQIPEPDSTPLDPICCRQANGRRATRRDIAHYSPLEDGS